MFLAMIVLWQYVLGSGVLQLGIIVRDGQYSLVSRVRGHLFLGSVIQGLVGA